jgi:putative transposase
MDQTMAACRLVYNLGLELKIWAYRNNIRLSIFELCAQIKDLRREYPWIASVNSQSLHRALLNLDYAYSRFFKCGGGFPKFKSKKGTQSFQCHNHTRRIDWDKGYLALPKIANIPIALSRHFEGEIKTVTISRTTAGKYFATILIKDKNELPSKPSIRAENSVGLDLGIKSFIATSDNQSYEPNQKLKENLQRLKCLQRRASRKKKGSINSKKSQKRVALLYEKISNQRADYIHKITTQLIRDSQVDTFIVEDLNVLGMAQNRKLSRPISDASFGEIFRQLKYKCEWYGKNLIVIDRFAPSSKRCSDCGEINQDLTLNDREWTCECGALHDRDLNAAKNIKYYGLLKHSPEGIGGEPVELLA